MTFQHRVRTRLGVTSVSVVVCGLLSACGTSFDRERVKILVEVQRHQYPDATARLNDIYGSHEAGESPAPHEGPVTAPSYNDKQILLWRMERGMVANLAERYPESDRHLDEAAAYVDERRTKSIAGETGTFLVNDTLRAYAGHGYEHIQVDYYRILNHLVQAERANGLIAVAEPPSPADAEDHYTKAVVRARRMTLEELTSTNDAADQHRYRDDPFARFLAGVVTWALPVASRQEEDQSFAQVMFKRSIDAYASEEKALGHDRYFRWEVQHTPHLVERLFLRHALAYDPGSYEEVARHYGIAAEPKPILPPGYGSLLVLDHVGFISRPQVLSIGFGSIAPPLSSSDRAAGASCNTFTIAGMGFWCKGPGADIAAAWVVPLPETVISHMTPGGMGIFGMELPVHDQEHPIRPPGRVHVQPVVISAPSPNATIPYESPLEVVSDLDAYARATLKDEQPRLLAKTITRAVSKQIIAAEAAVQAKKAAGGGAEGALVGAVVNLLGSATATLSEVADTRAWTTLPDHIEAALIDLPAGSYSIELETGYGVIPLGSIRVAPGQIVVVPTRTFPDLLPYPD